MKNVSESKTGFWGNLARKAKAILDDDDYGSPQHVDMHTPERKTQDVTGTDSRKNQDMPGTDSRTNVREFKISSM